MTMAKNRTVNLAPDDLRPHPLNKELYGPPTSNSAYKDIKANMARGYDDRHPLLVTEDRRILWGVTRWAAARANGIREVPCEIFVPSSPATAELEYEQEIIHGNVYRIKTRRMLACEQRKLMELEKSLGRQRMAQGSDGGPSKSADRVGEVYKVSGKTVTRRIKVLEALEEAEARGDKKKAERLADLLERDQVVKALETLKGKPAARKPPAVDVPRTLNDHNTKAYSENYEACAKATVPAEVDILEANVERMRQDVDTTRTRLGMPAPEPAAAGKGAPPLSDDARRLVKRQLLPLVTGSLKELRKPEVSRAISAVMLNLSWLQKALTALLDGEVMPAKWPPGSGAGPATPGVNPDDEGQYDRETPKEFAERLARRVAEQAQESANRRTP
jgi:hypothetical protein